MTNARDQRLFELAPVLVRLDHVASGIVKPDHTFAAPENQQWGFS